MMRSLFSVVFLLNHLGWILTKKRFVLICLFWLVFSLFSGCSLASGKRFTHCNFWHVLKKREWKHSKLAPTTALHSSFLLVTFSTFQEAHISAAVTSGSRAAVDIPTPTCAVVPTYALEKYVRFERPQSYVRARSAIRWIWLRSLVVVSWHTHLNTAAFEDTEVEYDMDGKDDDFLQKNFPNDKGLNDV